MAVTIDATWGGDTSNTYLTVAEASALLTSNVLNFDAWEDADEDQKTRALIVATQNIDTMDWLGARYFYHQKLEFPRTAPGTNFPYIYGTTATGNVYVDITESDDFQKRLKTRVQLSCSLQALYLLEKNCASRSVAKHRDYQKAGINSWSKSAAGISESYSYDRASTVILSPEAFDQLRYYKASPTVSRGDKGGLMYR